MANTIASTGAGSFASAREQFLAELTPYPVAACSIVDDDIVDGCLICNGNVTDTPINDDDEERVVLLHDTHAIGEKCARHWLATSNSCPKCRTPLFEEDDKDDDSDYGDATESVMQYVEYDESLNAHLQWQVETLMARDPATEAYDDREVTGLLCDVLRQINTLVMGNPDSEDPLLPRLFYEILEVRLQWYLHSPEQLNVQIPETFSNLFDAPGSMPTHNLHDRVLIDFDCSTDSLLRNQCFVNTILHGLDDEEGTVATAAAHPLSQLVVDSVEMVLEQLQGREVTVSALRQHLREYMQSFEELDSLNFLRPLPHGFETFMEWAQDVTVCTALLRTQAREAEELARRQQRERRARNQARRAQK